MVRLSMMKEQRREVLPGIQLLRGLAAAMVVFSHGNTMMSHTEFFGASPWAIRSLGPFSVGVFFIISGFIIAYVTFDSHFDSKIGLRDFAWRRFVRIVPFMWLCTIGYNALSYAGTGIVEWQPMLRAMVLFPIGELKPNVLWSLVHELIFYTLFAIAALGRKKRMWLLYAWFAAPLVYGGLLAATNGAILPADPTLVELARVVLLGNVNAANLQFAAGFGLALLTLRGSQWTAPRQWASLSLVMIVTIVLSAVPDIVEMPAGLARSVFWTILALVIGWLGLIATARQNVMSGFARVLGDASFSIYLVHNPALLVMFHLAMHLAPGTSIVLLYSIFVPLAILAGIAVHYLVEAPLIARLAHGQPLAPWLRLPGVARN